MKVIKEGIWSVAWKKEYTCQECQAILEVSEEDLKPEGNKTDNNYFNCPLCNKINHVDKKDLSTRVKEELNKKRQYWSSGGRD